MHPMFALAFAILAPIYAEASSVRAILDPIAAGVPKSEVMVLATPHLAGVEGFQPRFVDPVVEALTEYQPTIICVEVMPGEDLAAMEEAGGVRKEIAGMFASEPMALGRALRDTMKISRAEAERRADATQRGAMNDETRAKLVANLMAAYEYSTAMLQWSYIPESFRTSTHIVPEDVKAWLEKRLASNNEVSTVAIPLAHRLGIQTLVPVDSQDSAWKLLDVGEEALAEVFDHPLQKEVSKAAVYRHSREVMASGIAQENFLPVYLYFNDDASLAGDVEAQWGWYWQSCLKSGLDRLRYALWEKRNIDIASNVAMQTASARDERVLVIIGAAHKRFVEEFLEQLVHVSVVEFDAVAPAPSSKKAQALR